MRLILEGELRIRLRGEGEGLDIESADSTVHFSPLHMLAASLATCTYAVLTGWARQVGIETIGLEIDLAWDYVHDPYRVGGFDMTIRWPELPDTRRAAAIRVAEHCTVENTLRMGTHVETKVVE